MHSVKNNLGDFLVSLEQQLQLPEQFAGAAQSVADTVINRLSEQNLANLNDPVACPIDVSRAELESQFQSQSDGWKTLGLQLLDLMPYLPWQQRQEADHPAFMAGHANAQIIGPDGLVVSDNLLIGISLLAPHVTYPDHHHPPAEVYLVLTEGEWRQEAKPWHQPGAGGYVYNHPHVIHAMCSADKPLLAIWCLPL